MRAIRKPASALAQGVEQILVGHVERELLRDRRDAVLFTQRSQPRTIEERHGRRERDRRLVARATQYLACRYQ